MTRFYFYIVLCVLMFLGLSVFETLVEGEELTLQELLFEFLEAVVIFGAVAMTAIVAIDMKKMHEERVNLLEKIEKASFEGAHWRSLAENYILGLGEAIGRQFEEWEFTQSESEIAMLMLKGFSHTEIATLRATSEATVRQQASTIYRKSGLSSRRELTAYFLEDLTPPIQGAEKTVKPAPDFRK